MTLEEVIESSGTSGAIVAVWPVGRHRTALYYVATWRDTFTGSPGWWWALLPRDGEHVLDFGWVPGTGRDRDADVRRAIAKLGAKEGTVAA